MKILYVLEYYYPHVGGVEVAFQKISENCVKSGWTATVITSQLSSTPREEIVNGVKVIRVNTFKVGQRYWFTLFAFFKLLGHAKQYNLIHTTTYNAALPAWLIAKIFRKKIVLTVHEVWGLLWFKLKNMSKLIGLVHWLFEFIILKLPYDAYVAISDSTQKKLQRSTNKKDKIFRVYYGVDYNFFDSKKYDPVEIRRKHRLENKFIYLYFGRPGWAKGVEYLIHAVPEIQKKIPNAKLILILSKDPGKMYTALIKLIEKNNCHNDILVLSSVDRDELPKHILTSDCVVVPSLSEGFGFSIVESNALEVPVIASNAGSIPEVISGKYILVEQGNPLAIAKAVVSVFNNQYTETERKKFIWWDAVQKHQDLYKKLVNHTL